MPILDSYIKTLLDHAGADSIGLASGHPVTLVLGTERKAVGPVVELARIEEIVRDTFSPEERATFVNTGRTERTQAVTTPGAAGAKVRITARSAHGGMQVMVTLVGKPTPSGPLSLEGAPVGAPATPSVSTPRASSPPTPSAHRPPRARQARSVRRPGRSPSTRSFASS
jgi:hypothetical protein